MRIVAIFCAVPLVAWAAGGKPPARKAAPPPHTTPAPAKPELIETEQFSIVMPAGTKRIPTSLDSEFGPLEGADYEVEGDGILTFSYTDLSAHPPKGTTAERFYRFERAELLGRPSPIKSEKKIEVKVGTKSVPAVDVVAFTANKHLINVRFVSVGKRLYFLSYEHMMDDPSLAPWEAAWASLVLKACNPDTSVTTSPEPPCAHLHH